MSRRWRTIHIELYNEDGQQGTRDGPPAPARGGFDPEDLPSLISKFRADMQCERASIVYCEDGDALIVGVFDGVEPPAAPKRGTAYIPDIFDSML